MTEQEPIYQTTPAPAATGQAPAAAPYEVSYLAEQSVDFWAQVKTLLLRIQGKYPTMFGGVNKDCGIYARGVSDNFSITISHKKYFEGEEYIKVIFVKSIIKTESEVIAHLTSLL